MKSGEQIPIKQNVTFGKFQNIDLRVAKVLSAPLITETNSPTRKLTLDVGHLGQRVSLGQFALIAEEELVGRNVIIFCNVSPRQMGTYLSEVLVLGAPHPDSPPDQDQAIPLFIDSKAIPGDQIF